MKTTIRTATILFLATISLSAQELVRNGGFENAEPLEHWSWSSTVQGADLSATTVTVHSGNNSAKIRLGTNPLNVYSILRQTISTPENNTEYRLSFWIKGILAANMGGIYGTKGAREFPLGNDEKNNNDVIQSDAGSFRIKLNQISDWTKVEYYFDSGSDYSKYSLIFGVTTSGDSYDIFVDDFFIERIGPSPKQITMLSPNGGELWNAGEQYNITWDSEGVTNVLMHCPADSR